MTQNPSDRPALVCDIGGTNTRVGLAQGTQLMPETIQRFRNAEFESFEAVLRRYLEGHSDISCSGACVALAGPVRDGVGALTNLDWRIDHETLINATGADRAAILNDLQAQGHALGYLDAARLRPVLPMPPAGPHAAKLVIGIGTGFNTAAVYEAEAGRLVTPAETGHTSLPVTGAEDIALLDFLRQFNDAPAIEDALSGRGLERLYRFHAGEDQPKLDASAIMAARKDGQDLAALDAVATFVRLLGIAAGNLALVHLPFGGIYFSGGVARAMSEWFAPHEFGRWFAAKGRFSGFMQNFGISVIEDDFAALTGCASHLEALSRAR